MFDQANVMLKRVAKMPQMNNTNFCCVKLSQREQSDLQQVESLLKVIFIQYDSCDKYY